MVRLEDTDPKLIERLRELADPYGALGVASAAAKLTDPAALVHTIVRDGVDAEAVIAAALRGDRAARDPQRESEPHPGEPDIAPAPDEVESPPRPTVGRMVHYVAHGSKDGTHPKTCRAATVAALPKGYAPGLMVVSLVVLNPQGTFFDQAIRHAATRECGDDAMDRTPPATWHWPERV
jgi:hypothetical protein